MRRRTFLARARDLASTPDQLSAFEASSGEERRTLLTTEVDQRGVAPVQQLDWVAPRNLDTVGWLASADDLCAAMADLWTLSQQSGFEPITEILELNPGISPELFDSTN